MYKLYYLIAGFFLLNGCDSPKEEVWAPQSNIGWPYADSVRRIIAQAVIPLDTIYITQFQDNERNERIQLAIDQVAENGGGTVIIPSGIHFSGPIVLKNKTELHLEKGAELIFIAEPRLYPLAYTWFNGIPCMNYAPMISAHKSSDIKISGEGIINGQGSNPVWANMKYYEQADLNLLYELDKERVDAANREFGYGHFLRPNLIALVECSRLELSGVNLMNSPLSAVHFIKCTDVVVRKVNIYSKGYDMIGLVIESSSKVFVDSIHAESMNDGVKILSGRTRISQNKPSQDIFIQNSTFNNLNYSGVTVSLATAAGANRIFMNDIEVTNSDAAFKIHVDANFKEPVHDVFISDCQARNIQGSALVARVYHSNESADKPLLYNVHIDKLKVDSSGRSFFLLGHSKNLLYNISFSNSVFNTYKGSFVEDTKNLTWQNVIENGKESAGAWDFGYTEMKGITLHDPHVNDVLDRDDIKISDLPETVKESLSRHYFNVPIRDINRIITKSNVIYEIDFHTESTKKLKLLIKNNGEIIRSETELAFSDLPEVIVSALGSYIEDTPVSFMINRSEKIVMNDLVYYTIEGEHNHSLFALGITEDGNIIEKKHRSITFYFSPDKEKED